MMNRKLHYWSLFCLLLSLNNTVAFEFSNLLYSLKLCRGPGPFCPEPDCAKESKQHLCQWYDCSSTASRRSLKSSNSSCTFFGSLSSCGNDTKCLEACKKLNDGSCPLCISGYEEDECQDTVVYSAALVNSTDATTGTTFSGISVSSDITFYHGLLAFLLGAGLLAVVLSRGRKKSLDDDLTFAREGLVKGRMDAVEAGNASDISTVENRTQFRQTKLPYSMT
ncbi:unnamed protein product [Cylindrotheca closterium]|uniref:PSI domain-containing protein n=1 Tax=Cylindrotheca closterium TaxID=2856 RepID=A0AAD2PUV5_9STRA|nr:unnamed protein product [Cylindrotheca closterium]